jgi:tellurium resistance protein TerZ
MRTTLDRPARPTADEHFVLGLRWDPTPAGLVGWLTGRRRVDLDASCLMFDARGNLLDVVYHASLRSKDRAVVHSGDDTCGERAGDDEIILVRPGRVRRDVARLVFVVTSASGHRFGELPRAACRLYDMRRGLVVAQQELDGLGRATGLVAASLERTPDGWRPQVIGRADLATTHQELVPTIRRHAQGR